MEPALGQGTNSTFEDVWVLSDSLSRYGNAIEALKEYEKNCLERVTIVQYRTLFAAAQMLALFLKPQKFETSLGSMLKTAKLGTKEFSRWLYEYSSPPA